MDSWQKYLAATAILSGLLFLALNNIGSASLNGVQTASPKQVQNNNLSNLPFLSTTSCSSGSYDNCVTDTYTYINASATSTLLYDNLQYVDKTSDLYRVTSDTSIGYECKGSKAYFRQQTGDPEIEWSSNGGSTSYEELPLEGEIDLGSRAPLDGVQIICLDHATKDGFWSGVSVYSYWSKQIKVAENSDTDPLYDYEDACPYKADQGFGLKSNGCPVEDSDGDGEPDPDDDCPEIPGIESLNGCPNTKPSFASTDIPETVEANSSFVVSVQVEDPDSGQDLTVEWSNGDTGRSTVYEFEDTGRQGISVTASDGIDNVTRFYRVEVESQSTEDSTGSGFWNGLLDFFNNLF